MSDNVVHMNKKQQADADQKQIVEDQEEATSVASEFLYLTPALKQLHVVLSQAVVSGDVTQIVCGKEGGGKTLQLSQLLLNLETEQDVCVIHASHVLGEKHIIREVNRCFFAAKNISATEIVKRFANVSDGVDAQLNHPLIVVDDAHNLSSFALETLLSIKQQTKEAGGYLAILLFSQPEIKVTLSSPSLIPFRDLTCIHQMPVFDNDAAWEYLHLLINEYWRDEKYVLTVNEAKAITQKSGGIPGEMNKLVARAIKQHRHGHFISQFHKRPKMMISAAFGMFVLIFMAILFSGEEPLSSNLPMSAALNLEGQSTGRQELLASLSRNSSDPVSVDKKPLSSKVAVGKVKEENIQNRAANILPAQVKIKSPVKQVTPINKTESKVEALVKKGSIKETKAKPAEISGVKSAEVENKIASIVPVAPEKKKTIPKERIIPQAENEWLRLLAPDDYTIQLAASASEKAIIRFIKKQPVLPDLRYVHVKRRGGDWYVVLYGAYQSVSDARRVIKKLSKSLTKNNPWVRHASAIQKLLPNPEIKPVEMPILEPELKINMKENPSSETNESIVENEISTPVEQHNVP